jgi:DNA-binding NarL/FixJ family response regulator
LASQARAAIMARTRLESSPENSLDTHPRLAEIVDLRYFCGYTFEEIAAQRNASVRTIQCD